MGNIIITISWKPHTFDGLIINKLKDMAILRGLNITNDKNLVHYKPDYTQFCADISGLWLAFGRLHQKQKVVDFGEECKIILDSLNIKNYDIHIDDLPL
jgi:hypothetical protein